MFGIMSGQWLGLWLGRLPGWPSPPPSLASGYQAGAGFVTRDEGPIAGSMKLPEGERNGKITNVIPLLNGIDRRC